MSNRVVKVTRQNWGQRVSNSFGGLVFGLLLIPAAMIGLWLGEGLRDLSKIAATAVQVDADQAITANTGDFISATGTLGTNAQIGDAPYTADGDYISLHRVVEMYAWTEKSESSTQDDTVGGGSTTTTTYTYTKQWVENPENSSNFEEPTGHENPTKIIDSAVVLADYATVGNYEVDPRAIQLPAGDKITPNPGELPEGYSLAGEYIFSSKTAVTSPVVGDIRISYTALPTGKIVTAFGEQQGNRISSKTVEGEKFFRMFIGTHSEALETMHNEYVVLIWLVRIFGTLGIFIGLQLIVQPLARILGVIGILGKAVEGITGFINAFIAIVFGATIIIVSQIAHNIYLLIATLLLVTGAIYLYMRKRNGTLGGQATSGTSTSTTNTDVDTSPPKMT
ncbi:MAG: hypothetical protein RLY87_2324 [Chloroflexota bacterium]|jgi:hypothetical protein